MANVKVIQKENEEPIPAQIIAQSIAKIAEATQKMYQSGMNEKAIILLLSESSGVGRRDVGYVLSAMYHLKATYLVKPKTK